MRQRERWREMEREEGKEIKYYKALQIFKIINLANYIQQSNMKRQYEQKGFAIQDMHDKIQALLPYKSPLTAKSLYSLVLEKVGSNSCTSI